MEITDFLKDDNTIKVEVFHQDENMDEYPCWKETWYYPFTGIWGKVEILEKSRSYIKDVTVIANSGDIQIQTEIEGKGELSYFIDGKRYDTPNITIENCQYWQIEHPFLYHLTVVLTDGEDQDVKTVSFGVREFLMKEDGFYLNGKKIFIQGILQQGYYPEEIAFAKDVSILRKELIKMKEAGFNLLRLHIKPPQEETLKICDEIGMLVYSEPPIGWLKETNRLREHCFREVRELIKRDKNHPSVVIWGMINETGNKGWNHRGGVQNILEELCLYANQMDPTRVVVDQSGFFDTFSHGYGQSYFYYQGKRKPYWDLHSY